MQTPKLAIFAGATCALLAICLVGLPAEARDGGARVGERAGTAQPFEASAQSRRRRAPTRLRIERERTYLSPTAVRACDAWYEQEFRPSGTVIVPRMRCHWVDR